MVDSGEPSKDILDVTHNTKIAFYDFDRTMAVTSFGESILRVCQQQQQQRQKSIPDPDSDPETKTETETETEENNTNYNNNNNNNNSTMCNETDGMINALMSLPDPKQTVIDAFGGQKRIERLQLHYQRMKGKSKGLTLTQEQKRAHVVFVHEQQQKQKYSTLLFNVTFLR